MARITWGQAGSRNFEGGVDRGVLYVDGLVGVPWNGLVSVNEEADGGAPRPFYLDGYKYLNVDAASEYIATLSAFSSPKEFDVCDGIGLINNGLFATNQARSKFGLSYRTIVGDDIFGIDRGYKIHLVYNALATPTSRSYGTLSRSVNPMTLSWRLTTVAPLVDRINPTAHFIIDSRYTPESILKQIEDILYGEDEAGGNPYLPEISEIIEIFTGSSDITGYGVGRYGVDPYGI